MILSTSRSNIKFEFDGKIINVECEAYLPGYGSPDFVIYSNSVQHWESPYENEEINDDQRKQILEALKFELAQKNISSEIE